MEMRIWSEYILRGSGFDVYVIEMEVALIQVKGGLLLVMVIA